MHRPLSSGLPHADMAQAKEVRSEFILTPIVGDSHQECTISLLLICKQTSHYALHGNFVSDLIYEYGRFQPSF